MHRTASFPIHHVKQPSFFSPGLFCVRVFAFLSFLLSFRSPSEGMAERREAVSFILSRA